MPPDEVTFGFVFGRDPAVAAFQRFFIAQPPEARANILAFLHLCGPTEVRQADFHIGRSGAIRLVIRAKPPDDAAEPND